MAATAAAAAARATARLTSITRRSVRRRRCSRGRATLGGLHGGPAVLVRPFARPVGWGPLVARRRLVVLGGLVGLGACAVRGVLVGLGTRVGLDARAVCGAVAVRGAVVAVGAGGLGRRRRRSAAVHEGDLPRAAHLQLANA